MDADPWCLNEKTSHLLPFVVNPVNALKIWEVRNFPLDFLGQVRNIPRAEFSPAEKTPYRIPPPPGTEGGLRPAPQQKSNVMYA